MPGFILHIGDKDLLFPQETRKNLVVSRVEDKCFNLERRIVNKFSNDKVFLEDPDGIVLIDGVVLNNHQLMAKYAADNWGHCIKLMYRQNGDAFFKEFRGSFSGVLYDKGEDKWLIFTDHIGDKQVFYSKTPDGFLFGSEIGFLVEARKENGLPVSIDEIGCYMSLTHGFCIDDKTLVREVHKLIAGHYYKVTQNGVSICRYHQFDNIPDELLTEKEAIEGIDRLFRNAIKLQFEKDHEYGYRHLACLSGGLDSRMTVWVSHQMGYTDQLNITFSQSGYLDFSVAQQIAIDLHHDWLFKPLDGGDCIDLIDDVTPITYGSANFFGLAHGKSMEDLINYEPFGIIHTGQIGDSIIGSFFKKNEFNPEYKLGQSAYSLELIDRLSDYQIQENYKNEEIFCLYTRAFTGANQGLLTFQENSESCSPFLDVDFLEYCYKIPLKLRFGHRIYFDWILQKYPEAAEYVWEHTGQKIKPLENRDLKYAEVMGRRFPVPGNPEFLRWLKGSLLRRLGIRKKGQKTSTPELASNNNMNPVDYWYRTNPHLKEFMDNYWKDNKYLIPEGQLKEDMTHLYKDCVLYDKLQCLSVLSAIKLILS